VADWTTIASLATAAGTLVLAAATFSSVRSANRSARATERALLAGIRPLVVPSHADDAPIKVSFAYEHYVRVPGGRAVVEVTDDVIYLAISVRNVGNGIAVLDRWDFRLQQPFGEEQQHGDPSSFRRLTRDIYLPSAEVGFWQGAFRDREDPMFASVEQAVTEGQRITIDVLYGDQEGGQRTISRFSLRPLEDGTYLPAVVRHWNLDRPDPR
jgi:hypothetical protein